MLTNEGTIEEYFYGEKTFTEDRVGLFLMPTTSGTGSEVTSVSVLTDKVKNVKKPVVTPMFFADSAIVDPSLTYTMPPKITAITGFDAFCHAIEAYWAVSALPLCDAIGMYAVDLVVKNLRNAFDDGANKDAREKMAEASLMAGVAFSQTRTTAIHGVSYPLCTYGDFDHGSACATTMVPFMRFNYKEETKEKMDRLIEYCGFKSMTEFADFMQELMDYTGVSRKLRDAGISEDQLETIAEEGAAHGLTAVNPVKVTKEDVLTILKELY
jgi:alcohol dehydrogenase class IV